MRSQMRVSAVAVLVGCFIIALPCTDGFLPLDAPGNRPRLRACSSEGGGPAGTVVGSEERARMLMLRGGGSEGDDDGEESAERVQAADHPRGGPRRRRKFDATKNPPRWIEDIMGAEDDRDYTVAEYDFDWDKRVEDSDEQSDVFTKVMDANEWNTTELPDLDEEGRDREKLAINLLKNKAIQMGEIADPRYEGKTDAELAFIDAMELLMFGATEDNVTMVRQAVALGADVNGCDPEMRNETALHACCSVGKGYINIVKVLLELGADPNAVNVNNNTALHEAAYWAHKDCVVALLEAGADPFIINADGNTALLQAEGNFRAIGRPWGMYAPKGNIENWDNETKALNPVPWLDKHKCGWRDRYRGPDQRQDVVDILIEAMGDGSYGRGADAYCGGVKLPNPFTPDKSMEHYNPPERPRSGVDSMGPPPGMFEKRDTSKQWNWPYWGEVDKILEEFHDELMAKDEIQDVLDENSDTESESEKPLPDQEAAFQGSVDLIQCNIDDHQTDEKEEAKVAREDEREERRRLTEDVKLEFDKRQARDAD